MNMPRTKLASVLKWALAGVFFTAYLWPFLTNGFYADDCLNSQIGNVLLANNISLYEFSARVTGEWVHGVGRLLPAGLFGQYLFYYLFPDLPWARAAHMLIVLAGLLFCGAACRRWTGSRQIAFLMPVLAASLIQMRAPFDPVASYPTTMVLLAAEVVGAYYFASIYLTRKSRSAGVASVALFLLAVLTYEVAWLMLPALLALPWLSPPSERPPRKQVASYLVPLISVCATVVAVSVYIRMHRTSTYQGTEFASNVGVIFCAYFYQLTAAFPFSFILGQVVPSQRVTAVLQLGMKSWPALIAAGSGAALLFSQLRPSPFRVRRELWVLFASLTFLPALIALSAKSQAHIRPGMGYIPVYLCYLGVGIGLSLLLSKLANRFQTSATTSFTFRAITTATFALMIFFHSSSNLWEQREQDRHYREPREHLIEAYRNWALEGVDPGSLIISKANFQWNNDVLDEGLIRKSIHLIPLFSANEEKAINEHLSSSQRPSVHFQDVGSAEDSAENKWYVLFSRIVPGSEIKASATFANAEIEVDRPDRRPMRLALYCESKLISSTDLPVSKEHGRLRHKFFPFACSPTQLSVRLTNVGS